MSDLLEAMRPIVATPSEDLGLLIGQMDLNTVAVELDFVNPAVSSDVRAQVVTPCSFCACGCRRTGLS